MFHRSNMLVSNFRNEMNDGVARAVADVDGIPLWFESADVKLVAAPEAYGSALLLPSQHRRRRLVLDAPVSREWFANITGVLSIWGKWWGYHGLSPICALSDENGAEASIHFTALSVIPDRISLLRSRVSIFLWPTKSG